MRLLLMLFHLAFSFNNIPNFSNETGARLPAHWIMGVGRITSWVWRFKHWIELTLWDQYVHISELQRETKQERTASEDTKINVCISFLYQCLCIAHVWWGVLIKICLLTYLLFLVHVWIKDHLNLRFRQPNNLSNIYSSKYACLKINVGLILKKKKIS